MMNRITPMVKNLLIVNVIVFAIQLAMESFFNLDSVRVFGLRYFGASEFAPYQLITYMFSHSTYDIMHIIGNMFALYMFGSSLEQAWGSKRFLQFYLITGIGAGVLYQFASGIELYMAADTFSTAALSLRDQAYMNIPMVGASGAVFGILLAFGMLFPNVRLMLLFPPIPIKAKYFVLFYGLYELYATIQNSPTDNTAHLAHLGGMLFAFILIKMWKK